MIPLIRASGSSIEIGRQIGQQASEQIGAAVESTRAEFARSADSQVHERIGTYVAITETYAPAVVAEMRGMAEGAGVSFEDIFVLNASAELHQEAGRFSECTVTGVTQSGTADGHVLLAHNEDATAGWNSLAYVLWVEPESAPAFVAFTYAGLLLHQGVNSAGIASVGNALYARDARPGIPKLLQYRRVLAERTIEGAIRVALDEHRAFGNNHLITNATGDMFNLEVSGSSWAMVAAGNGFLVHANHFVQPSMTHLDVEEDLINSRMRHARVNRLIEQEWGSLTHNSLREIMSDHSNYPKSVCKHAAPESELDYGTIGSVVIDVNTRTLWACAGNPCRSDWRQVTLASTT